MDAEDTPVGGARPGPGHGGSTFPPPAAVPPQAYPPPPAFPPSHSADPRGPQQEQRPEQQEQRRARRFALAAGGGLAALVALALVLTLLARGGGPAPAGPAATGGDTAPSGRGTDLEARVSAFTSPFVAGTGYRAPTAAQRRAVADGVALAAQGRTEEATAELAKADYRITELTDSATGRRTAEIADAAPQSEGRRGWGRVYIDLSVPHPSWTLQVPHPVADSRTENLGVEVFRAAPGGIMVLAGSHRRADPDGASDPAHRADTVFAAVLEGLATRGLPGIQVHGFDEASLAGQDSVVSTGTAPAGPAAELTAAGLAADGWNICRAWKDSCGQLEGTTNVEGRFAAGLGVPWLHVELATRLRTEPDLRGRVAATLAATARSWTAAPPRP
ncbi:hypothetical protein ACIQBJ_31715 [Kitasatospora sp. NPDC088391]|uniref:hypothetical protein n=1 Tax=Kitasatospora sp. NPDC088391 TaxID=3364074 RepID=UPI003801A1DC